VSSVCSYNVDVVHSRSAEITAAYASVSIYYVATVKLSTDLSSLARSFRSLILSVAAALVVSSIERIGVAWTDIIAAVLSLVGQG